MPTYALATCVFGDLGRDEILTRTAEAGFREIELGGTRGRLDDWPADPTQMRRDLATHGLQVRSVHSPVAGWGIAASDDSERLAAVEATVACFGQSAEVGAEIVVCHPNRMVIPVSPEAFEPIWARSCESLAILAERAREAGVKIALENMPSAQGPGRPGATMAHVLTMIEGLGEHVGICLDVGHSVVSGQDPTAEALEAGDRLLVLHLQDNDGRTGHDQHLIPGQGIIDWDAFLAAVDGVAYRGVRTIEITHRAGLDTMLEALASLRQEWEAR